ncbi:MAG TPA: hypothetical protein VER33_11830 [Polyangiaceae bacterium]|nr:hypothetical protein [Polyangiaceae bacterium]
MANNLEQALKALPESGMTVRLLKTLDYLAPGEWKNLTNLHDAIVDATGESDEEVITAVAGRAIELFMDPANGYQRALSLYSTVDSTSTFAGFTSLAGKLGEDVQWLAFLGKVTPKVETTQAVDAGLKLACEVAAFCMTNGLPGDSIGDFVGALGSSAKEDKMRITTWIACDCFLPLGPDFLSKITSVLSAASESDFMQNGLFQRIAQFLPGGGTAEKKAKVTGNVRAVEGYVKGVVADRQMTHPGVLAKIKGFIDVNEERLDYLASIIDLSTSYFLHTGTQSVARRAITRAYGEI